MVGSLHHTFSGRAERQERKAARQARKGSPKGKWKKGWPTLTPEQLWRMDPSARPVAVGALLTGGVLNMGHEDEIVAIAKGARTSFKYRKMEDRATIRGGLAALRSAGLTKADPGPLSSRWVQGKGVDQKLIQAAGGGRDLKSAAAVVRKRVAVAGLERSAWGARGLYVLSNLKGFQVVRGAVATGVSLIPGVGLLIGAAMGIHGSITAKAATEAARKFSEWAAPALQGTAVHGKRNGGQRSAPEPLETPETKPVSLGWWLLGGGAAIVAALAIRNSKQESRP